MLRFVRRFPDGRDGGSLVGSEGRCHLLVLVVVLHVHELLTKFDFVEVCRRLPTAVWFSHANVAVRSLAVGEAVSGFALQVADLFLVARRGRLMLNLLHIGGANCRWIGHW